MKDSDFPPCPICRLSRWHEVYNGPVRDGSFGNSRDGSVGQCDGCGVQRLEEGSCLSEGAYQGNYRDHLGQGHDLARHFATHDEMQRFVLDLLWPHSLRGKKVADVGCGGGSLLDHIRGVAGTLVAIDPDLGFAPSLRQRGYIWHASAKECAEQHAGTVDVAVSIQVIEHVSDPVAFLQGIRRLLQADGSLLISTPNRRDILMELLPDRFPKFFYRTQHRWIFDAHSLARCAEGAQLRVEETRFVHRYGMANALLWLREGSPPGRARHPAIDRSADAMWRTWLESTGRADNLFMVLKPALPA